jgi:hypothetical protein
MLEQIRYVSDIYLYSLRNHKRNQCNNRANEGTKEKEDGEDEDELGEEGAGEEEEEVERGQPHQMKRIHKVNKGNFDDNLDDPRELNYKDGWEVEDRACENERQGRGGHSQAAQRHQQGQEGWGPNRAATNQGQENGGCSGAPQGNQVLGIGGQGREAAVTAAAVATVAAPGFQTSVKSAFRMQVKMSLSALESSFNTALGKAIKSGNSILIVLKEIMVDEPNKMLLIGTCMLCIIQSINKAGTAMTRGKNNGCQV